MKKKIYKIFQAINTKKGPPKIDHNLVISVLTNIKTTGNQSEKKDRVFLTQGGYSSSQTGKTLTVSKKSNVLDKIPPRGPKTAAATSPNNQSNSNNNNSSSVPHSTGQHIVSVTFITSIPTEILIQLIIYRTGNA